MIFVQTMEARTVVIPLLYFVHVLLAYLPVSYTHLTLPTITMV